MKPLLFLGLCLGSLITGQAQHSVRIGIKAGINLGQVQTSQALTKLLWRYNAGIALEQPLTPQLALALELAYTRQGGKVSSTNGYITDQFITSFDDVAVPLLLRFRPKGERGFIEVGGQVGYLTNATSYHSSNKDQTLGSISHTNKVDAGLVGGIGFRLSSHWVVDARYYYGVRPLRGDYTANDPQTGVATYYRVEKWYNRVYSLNLSYYFR